MIIFTWVSCKDVLDELIKSGQIKGSLHGGRQALSAVYVPDFFVKAQKQYVEAFLKQNGYIGKLGNRIYQFICI